MSKRRQWFPDKCQSVYSHGLWGIEIFLSADYSCLLDTNHPAYHIFAAWWGINQLAAQTPISPPDIPYLDSDAEEYISNPDTYYPGYPIPF